VYMHTIRDCAAPRNRNNTWSPLERDLRAERALLQARYDSGAVSPAIVTILKTLAHRG
jgi:hypothetical protein